MVRKGEKVCGTANLSDRVREGKKQVMGDLKQRFRTKTDLGLAPGKNPEPPPVKSEECDCDGRRTLWTYKRERIEMARVECLDCEAVERRESTAREREAVQVAFLVGTMREVEDAGRLAMMLAEDDEDLRAIWKMLRLKKRTA